MIKSELLRPKCCCVTSLGARISQSRPHSPYWEIAVICVVAPPSTATAAEPCQSVLLAGCRSIFYDEREFELEVMLVQHAIFMKSAVNSSVRIFLQYVHEINDMLYTAVFCSMCKIK